MFRTMLSLSLILALSTLANATVPISRLLNYQGRLAGINGVPVPDGPKNLFFKIYVSGDYANPVYNQALSVPTTGGLFSVSLDLGKLTFDPTKTYELSVNHAGEELKTVLTSVPMALGVTNAVSVGFADGTSQTTAFSPNSVILNGGGQQDVTSQNAIQLRFNGVTNANYAFRVNAINTQMTGDTQPRNYNDLFTVRADSGIVAKGVLGIGVIPASGAGERMMWHPYKAAFRVGSIGSAGTQWDDPNVGFYTMATGYNTTALGLSSVAMGYQSSALGSYSFAAGYTDTADGTGAVALGYRCTADADYSYAIGQRAQTNGHAGAMVLADGSTTAYVNASSNNQLMGRFAGGVVLYTNSALTSGVSVAAGGGSWSALSDRRVKDHLKPVDTRDLLKRVAGMPVATWNYKSQDPKIRHIGPMAQDFSAAFHVGEDNTHITTVDEGGVALAAIQGLYQEVKDRDTKIAALDASNKTLAARLAAIEKRLARHVR